MVTQWADGIVQILYAEEYQRPDYNEMLSVVWRLISKYDVDKVYIDGANPSFIKSLIVVIHGTVFAIFLTAVFIYYISR